MQRRSPPTPAMTHDDYDSEFEEDEGGKATVFGHAFDWGESEDKDLLDPDAEGAELHVLRFDLGGQGFAVEAIHLVEVDQPPQLTPVPGLPPHIAGVAVRRRQVLTVLDLATFFGLNPVPSVERRLIIFEAAGLEAGTVVSSISGLEVWPEDDEVPDLDNIDGKMRPYVTSSRWAPGGRVLLLNVAELLRAAAVR